MGRTVPATVATAALLAAAAASGQEIEGIRDSDAVSAANERVARAEDVAEQQDALAARQVDEAVDPAGQRREGAGANYARLLNAA